MANLEGWAAELADDLLTDAAEVGAEDPHAPLAATP